LRSCLKKHTRDSKIRRTVLIDENPASPYRFYPVPRREGTLAMNQSGRLEVAVECETDHHGEEIPVRFYMGERLMEIDEILDRWPDQAHRYFKLRGSDAGIYILRHDMDINRWEMIMFDSGTRSGSKLSST
jgi:hypothetical protein